MVQSFALYRSYPAAKALPLVGVLAEGESFFTSKGGDAESGGGGGAFSVAPSAAVDVMSMDSCVFERLARGELGSDGGGWTEGGVDMAVSSL